MLLVKAQCYAIALSSAISRKEGIDSAAYQHEHDLITSDRTPDLIDTLLLAFLQCETSLQSRDVEQELMQHFSSCNFSPTIKINISHPIKRKPTYRFQSNQLQDGTGLRKDGVGGNGGINMTRRFCDATQPFCNLVDTVNIGQ
ncbi:hypothetical protein OUZ56_022135 [Daphnia magna]|uniref:Uncharacterized protein n=1 Tax=Daphnia magna TaxID=35525 RepID=A0ABR0AVK9_9CRUS|nr:hypothetical protein OUZ56_022135 [Daphnia magna]